MESANQLKAPIQSICSHEYTGEQDLLNVHFVPRNTPMCLVYENFVVLHMLRGASRDMCCVIGISGIQEK